MNITEMKSWADMSIDVNAALVKGDKIFGSEYAVAAWDPQSMSIITTQGIANELDKTKVYWAVFKISTSCAILITHDSWSAAQFWHKFETGEMEAFKTTVVSLTDKQLMELDAQDTMAYYKPILDKWLLRLRKKERFRREAKANKGESNGNDESGTD